MNTFVTSRKNEEMIGLHKIRKCCVKNVLLKKIMNTLTITRFGSRHKEIYGTYRKCAVMYRVPDRK